MKILRLTHYDGPIDIFASHITHMRKHALGTSIYVVGYDYSLDVKESMNEIKKMILVAQSD